ncbi:MAG: hypothetical protein QM594_22795 [Niabella sp.]
MLDRIRKELRHFRSHLIEMRVLLITNLLFALVLPVLELFVGAYIMRNTNDMKLVVFFQLATYAGIPLTFLVNGYLLRVVKITRLYSFGMLLSGISMFIMMMLDTLTFNGIIIAGFIMGLSYGFFWANRDFLALNSTNDANRNYYYGLETFFYTVASVMIPYTTGAFLAQVDKNGWFGSNINIAYYILTGIVFIITVFASLLISNKGNFNNPCRERFVYFRFHQLWNKMMGLSVLKGLAQGYIVTAPAILIMSLVGREDVLGIVQSGGAIISAVLMYLIGRASHPSHRISIFAAGLLLFVAGGLVNAIFYSSLGVYLFLVCLLLSRPLLDLAYFPLQLKVIDYVAAIENRNKFSYIFIHEFGLFTGRLIGCGLFILLATYISDMVALRYAILVISVLQLFSLFIANKINRGSDKPVETSMPAAAEPAAF